MLIDALRHGYPVSLLLKGFVRVPIQRVRAVRIVQIMNLCVQKLQIKPMIANELWIPFLTSVGLFDCPTCILMSLASSLLETPIFDSLCSVYTNTNILFVYEKTSN